PMSFLSKLFGREEPVEINPDVQGQVEALLTNRVYEYASTRLGVELMTPEFYRKVFTVRRKEIEEYLAQHEIKLEEYGDEYHWLSLHQEGDKWIVRQFFPPEKGPGYDMDTEYSSYEKARSALLDKLI